MPSPYLCTWIDNNITYDVMFHCFSNVTAVSIELKRKLRRLAETKYKRQIRIVGCVHDSTSFIVDSIVRPGRNCTGISMNDYIGRERNRLDTCITLSSRLWDKINVFHSFSLSFILRIINFDSKAKQHKLKKIQPILTDLNLPFIIRKWVSLFERH